MNVPTLFVAFVHRAFSRIKMQIFYRCAIHLPLTPFYGALNESLINRLLHFLQICSTGSQKNYETTRSYASSRFTIPLTSNSSLVCFFYNLTVHELTWTIHSSRPFITSPDMNKHVNSLVFVMSWKRWHINTRKTATCLVQWVFKKNASLGRSK